MFCGGDYMALSPRFLDDLKARITLSDLVGKKVRLTRKGKEHSGLCPFHNEKTPSFTVNDQKGFYHCFGCGAHGSAIDWMMEHEGLAFRESVESLAGMAGIDMPVETPQDRARAETRKSLTEIMALVADWYQKQLYTQAGRAALDYVKGRGLSDAALQNFGLGYAPAARTALKDDMAQRGIAESDLVELGMLIKPEDGSPAYDRFRDRLMFPITNRQDKVIAFGGRALSKDAKAKYLNSPETLLFHKGETLYNWARARKAAFDVGALIIVEGYMDVIALDEAGINHAVAPLGTALTEEQMLHAWAMADEPVLSFDGDKAGLRAANRAVERALPLLKAGKSLRFLMLPEGEDPDSLIRAKGRGDFDTRLDGATALVNQLWTKLTEGVDASTPERLAGLEKMIFSELAQITDDNVKALYVREYKDRVWQTYKARKPQTGYRRSGQTGFGRSGSGRTGSGAVSGPRLPKGALKRTHVGEQAGTDRATGPIEQILAACMVNHPSILARYEEEIAGLDFALHATEMLRTLCIRAVMEDVTLERVAFQAYLREMQAGPALDMLLQDAALRRGAWFAFEEAALSDALTGFEQALARLAYFRVKADFEAARDDYMADMSDANHRRFLAAQDLLRESEHMDVNIVGFGLESNKPRVE